MEIHSGAIADILVIQPEVHSDDRGFFLETYRRDALEAAGIRADFVQDNHSHSKKGVLRGLHYQVGRPQGKLVRVAAGEVFDVAVDLRKKSPTFGRWMGEVLSAENARQIWIPEGFAHGFFVLSDRADVVYKTTDYYFMKGDRALRWDDPELAIRWPLIDGERPILSEKDRNAPLLSEAELFE
ncbi:MAG: dTDP-4-dehydrorhamnose 3,5-epimerase [Anaerolineales bacterium]